MVSHRLTAFACCVVLCLLPLAGNAEERILSYDVTASVGADASVTVTEQMQFAVEGDKIKRGIIRVFPVEYRTAAGDTRQVGFDLVSATLDGAEVQSVITRSGSNLEIRLGDADILVEHGVRTYAISYRTTGQVLFLDDHDELFWNVTGNDWDFPIDRATYRIQLPGNANDRILASAGFTGFPGEKGEDYTQAGNNVFETTRPLAKGEGFSVAVGWEKGVVAPPSPGIGARMAAWMTRNKGIVMACFVAVVTAYYFIAWLMFGRDPRRGTVVPLFEPPEGMEPGYMCFVRNMGFSQACFTADLLHLAVKGLLHVEEDEKTLTLRRRFGDIKELDLPASQHNMLTGLFPKPEAEVVTTSTQSGAGALWHARRNLQDIYDIRGKKLFTWNLGPGLLGLLLFLPLLFVFDFVESPLFKEADVLDHLVYLFILLLGSGFIIGGLAGVREGIMKRFRSSWVRPAVLAGAALMLLLGLRLVWGDLRDDPVLTGGILAAVAITAVFLALLPARTKEGVRLLDLVEGLAMFMETSERNRLEMMNPPEETPALFESLLPYAFALDCADTWANRFQSLLDKASYDPDWYTRKDQDPHYRFQHPGFAVLFARALADQTRRSADSYTPTPAKGSATPAWSGGSGLGGGGSSGGGGGGGGGRGW